MTELETHSEESPAEAADRLVGVMRSMQRVAVAFSGGVDSTVVAKAAFLALGDQAGGRCQSRRTATAWLKYDRRNWRKRLAFAMIALPRGISGHDGYVRNDGALITAAKSTSYDTLAKLHEK
ncbi:MAG: hypothetical protein U1D30_03795 [Planctomycetota bacterium]